MEFTQLAAQTTHFKKLVRFIKLKDIMLTRSNLQLALDVMDKMREHLQFTPEKFEMQNNKKKRMSGKQVKYPIYKIEAVFDEQERQIIFKPSMEEFKSFMNEILEEAHKSIAKVGTLSDRPEFNDHLRVKENEGQKDNPDDP